MEIPISCNNCWLFLSGNNKFLENKLFRRKFHCKVRNCSLSIKYFMTQFSATPLPYRPYLLCRSHSVPHTPYPISGIIGMLSSSGIAFAKFPGHLYSGAARSKYFVRILMPQNHHVVIFVIGLLQEKKVCFCFIILWARRRNKKIGGRRRLFWTWFLFYYGKVKSRYR